MCTNATHTFCVLYVHFYVIFSTACAQLCIVHCTIVKATFALRHLCTNAIHTVCVCTCTFVYTFMYIFMYTFTYIWGLPLIHGHRVHIFSQRRQESPRVDQFNSTYFYLDFSKSWPAHASLPGWQLISWSRLNNRRKTLFCYFFWFLDRLHWTVQNLCPKPRQRKNLKCSTKNDQTYLCWMFNKNRSKASLLFATSVNPASQEDKTKI